MERKITIELGRRTNGTTITRYHFINEDVNYLTKAHSYFTKDERKLAKWAHKNSK